MIGGRVDYLESIAGPAMRAGPGVSSYVVDGCNLEVGQILGEVRYLRLGVSPKCTFDLGMIMPNYQLGRVDRLTLGDFDKSVGLSSGLAMNCLRSCGRDPDFPPGIYERAGGSMADEQIEVMVGADPRRLSDREIDHWVAGLAKAHGQAWVADERYVCDDESRESFKPIAAKLQVDEITIGNDFHPPADRCPT